MASRNDGSDALLTDGAVDFGLETALEDLLEEFGASNSSADLRTANTAASNPLPMLDGGSAPRSPAERPLCRYAG